MEWRNLPPMSALRAFAAYAQYGSLQQAGDALNVTHAAISQQIRNLETRLGLTLLDRSARQGRLSAEGKVLADVVLAGFDAMAEQVAQLTGDEEARPLTVTTTPSFAANWLVPRLADFRMKHPEIDVVIDANPAPVALGGSGPDVAIRFGQGDWAGTDALLLIATRRVAVAAPSFVRADRPASPVDLARFPILQEVGTSESSLWLAKHGVPEAWQGGRIILPGNLTIDAARMGQGITVTAEIWVRSDLESGRLVKLFEDDEDFGYYIVTRANALRPSARAFVKWLDAQASHQRA